MKTTSSSVANEVVQGKFIHSLCARSVVKKEYMYAHQHSSSLPTPLQFTVDTFESTTNPPNGSYIVMSRREGEAALKTPGRTGGGVYELPPESADLISLR